jgi:hypothetical protein
MTESTVIDEAVDLSKIPSSLLARELARRKRPDREKLSPCEFCAEPYGVRAMKEHRRECVSNPRNHKTKESQSS